jgi:hypothetical protein
VERVTRSLFCGVLLVCEYLNVTHGEKVEEKKKKKNAFGLVFSQLPDRAERDQQCGRTDE